MIKQERATKGYEGRMAWRSCGVVLLIILSVPFGLGLIRSWYDASGAEKYDILSMGRPKVTPDPNNLNPAGVPVYPTVSVFVPEPTPTYYAPASLYTPVLTATVVPGGGDGMIGVGGMSVFATETARAVNK